MRLPNKPPNRANMTPSALLCVNQDLLRIYHYNFETLCIYTLLLLPYGSCIL